MQMEGRPRGQAPLGAAVARGQPPARPYPTPRGISEPAKRRRKERGRNPPAAILRAGRKSLRAVCGETMRAVPEPSEGGDNNKEVRLPTPRTARACTEHRITAKITTIRKKKTNTQEKIKPNAARNPSAKEGACCPHLRWRRPSLAPPLGGACMRVPTLRSSCLPPRPAQPRLSAPLPSPSSSARAPRPGRRRGGPAPAAAAR